MIFNSLHFVAFFLVFFTLYWAIPGKNFKLQNLLILGGSYFMYAYWDWRFLSLLITTSALYYGLGLAIYRTDDEQRKRLYIILGVVFGVGALFVFKYLDFFITSLNTALSQFQVRSSMHTLRFLLPLGISFYIFRSMSYLFDINKGKQTPTTDWVAFFSHVAFFPSLVSGPIDKPSLMLPQLEQPRRFDYFNAVMGLRLILWGLFKKMVVADNCAIYTDSVFANFGSLPASALLLGAFLYTVQIYADFSGYSEMALGIARLIGFRITRNFDYPYFSQNIADHWRRWHMSLTAWLTEYVFTPLSITFRDRGNLGLILAIVINFTICGIWHGANWTYILFGFLHGCYFIPMILAGTMNKKVKVSRTDRWLPGRQMLAILSTFTLVMFTFIIFRAETVGQAFRYMGHMVSTTLFTAPTLTVGNKIALCFVPVLFVTEWLNREKEFALQFTNTRSATLRISVYYILILTIFFFGVTKSNSFIYIQF